MKEGRINITGVELTTFAKWVYNLSQPVGMGFLHYDKTPLTDEEAESLIPEGSPRIALRMDYVKGRQCKMTVWREMVDGKEQLTINDRWYDHTAGQLRDLLLRCELPIPASVAANS